MCMHSVHREVVIAFMRSLTAYHTSTPPQAVFAEPVHVTQPSNSLQIGDGA